MQLVEQHIIRQSSPQFGAIDAASFAAKNLYNAANYLVRQSFIHENVYLNYYDVHAQMKDHDTYKAELAGIQVILVNESHTSKCSFLDDEPVQHHEHYAGKRIKRGLFRASDGRLINADVNGAYNIIRKAIPEAFGQGKAGVVVHPVGIAPTY